MTSLKPPCIRRNGISIPALSPPCQVVEASEFFRERISGGDPVVFKFNCEGAEIPIINNLIDTGEIWKVSHMLISWDCMVITGQEHQKQLLIDRMASIGFDRWISSEIAYAPNTQPHDEKVAAWLGRMATDVRCSVQV